MSYGFYVFHDIFHEPCAILVRIVAGPMSLDSLRLATAGIAFVGTLLLAFLSFRYLETPFLGLKRFYTEDGAAPTEGGGPVAKAAMPIPAVPLVS